MTLLIKILTFLGVASNFAGSIMLLRDFRDLVPIPLFRFFAGKVRRQANAIAAITKDNNRFADQHPNFHSGSRRGVGRAFSRRSIRLAHPADRTVMRTINLHNKLRKIFGLSLYDISQVGGGLNAVAVQASFNEIDSEITKWAIEPDPEARIDRRKAVTLFILGFALLLLGAFLDLVATL